MSEFKLEPVSLLNGYKQQYEGVALHELSGVGKVSVAIPHEGEKEAVKVFKKIFEIGFPAIGTSALSADKSARVIRLGNDQLFILLFDRQPDPGSYLAEKFGEAVYLTDQSDAWVGLEISGAKVRQALERICMIDLHQDGFLENHAARTMMEHLGVLIIRTGKDCFILMSASSSAKSFLHAVTTSIKNIE